MPCAYHTVLYIDVMLQASNSTTPLLLHTSATVYSSKKPSQWWNVGFKLTRYKKFVLKNVKFHHIIKFHEVQELLPIVKFVLNNYAFERYTRVSRVLFLDWCRTDPATYTVTFCLHQNNLGRPPCLLFLSYDVFLMEPKPRVDGLGQFEHSRINFFLR